MANPCWRLLPLAPPPPLLGTSGQTTPCPSRMCIVVEVGCEVGLSLSHWIKLARYCINPYVHVCVHLCRCVCWLISRKQDVIFWSNPFLESNFQCGQALVWSLACQNFELSINKIKNHLNNLPVLVPHYVRTLQSAVYVIYFVKVYEITSGTLICSILFDFGLTCVTMDLAEQWIFVGAGNGKIFQVNLQRKVHIKDVLVT